MTSGSSTIVNARMRGLSDEYGSWKTICMSRRAARIRALENASTFSPRNSTSPEVGSTSRSMQRPGRALAAARLADQRERLALLDA